jgi:hypothetical protein
MNMTTPHAPTKVTVHRRALGLLLLVATVYQMGACPCGCVKYNYWVRAARWWNGNASSPATPSSSPPTVARNDDDCTHETRELAEPDSKSLRAAHDGCTKPFLTSELSCSDFWPTVSLRRMPLLPCRSPPRTRSASELRAVLGVFLI